MAEEGRGRRTGFHGMDWMMAEWARAYVQLRLYLGLHLSVFVCVSIAYQSFAFHQHK